MQIIKWVQLLLLSTGGFIYKQLNGFKPCYLTIVILFNINGFKTSKWLKSSIWPIVDALTGTTMPFQNGPGSKD